MPTQMHTPSPGQSLKPLHPANTLIGAALLIVVLAWGAFGSGDITMFIDVNSLIWVVGIIAAGLWMCFGPKTVLMAIHCALFGSGDVSQTQLTRTIAVLGRAYQLAWAAGLSGFLLGLVIMLKNMDDPVAIGPGMAVSLLTTIYGLILAEFIFSPLQQVQLSHSNNQAPAESSHTTSQRSMMPLGITVVIMACLAFLVLAISIWQ